MIEKINLEVDIPYENSVICDATLKFEIKGTIDAIKRFNKTINKQISQEQ